MTDEQAPEDRAFSELEALKDAPVAPAHAIASVALSLAIKYHDMGMIKDGTLYQQYKLEGRNIQMIGLEHVFETAVKMEAFLLGSSERIAKLIVDAVSVEVVDDPPPATEGS